MGMRTFAVFEQRNGRSPDESAPARVHGKRVWDRAHPP